MTRNFATKTMRKGLSVWTGEGSIGRIAALADDQNAFVVWEDGRRSMIPVSMLKTIEKVRI